jgi:hypothetical protein
MTQPDDRLEDLFIAAAQHGKDTSEPEHQIGDLEDLLRAAWEILSPDQRERLMKTDAAVAVLKNLGDAE